MTALGSQDPKASPDRVGVAAAATYTLLRLSLHDPVMPLNIEGGRKGDLPKLVEIARKLTDGFDRLDRSCLK